VKLLVVLLGVMSSKSLSSAELSDLSQLKDPDLESSICVRRKVVAKLYDPKAKYKYHNQSEHEPLGEFHKLCSTENYTSHELVYIAYHP
jgi:hypothetical protein